MRTFILSLLLLTVTITTKGQIVSSVCTAPDSIVLKYKDDADRLVVRKIYRNNLSYKDSVFIPQLHSDTALSALIAVYNATTLAARDTVVTQLNIHTIPDYGLNSIAIKADSDLDWMQQLKIGNIPTGNSSVDSLITKYQLAFGSYHEFSNVYSWHLVVLTSANNYNIYALASLFTMIPDVLEAYPNTAAFDGNNIKDSIYADHVELIYSYGWDDCLAGCINRRFWKFNVYFDCSVEFVGSYGDQLPYIGTGINGIDLKHLSLYPNPFKETIFIEGLSSPFVFSMSNVFGQELIRGLSFNNSIDNLNRLPSGFYILTIKEEKNTVVFKVFKE